MSEHDLKIEYEEHEDGRIKQVTITAFTEQAEIDLAMEFPRIKKLLERDWQREQDEPEA